MFFLLFLHYFFVVKGIRRRCLLLNWPYSINAFGWLVLFAVSFLWLQELYDIIFIYDMYYYFFKEQLIMVPFGDRNMYTNSGIGNKGNPSEKPSDAELADLGFRALTWPFRFVWHCILKPVFGLVWSILSGILMILQALFWFGLIAGGIMYFASDSFHAYVNEGYLMRKAEFKLAFSEPLPDDWGRKEYMSIAAMETDKLMVREREKFYVSLPLARKDYQASVQIVSSLDRASGKLGRTVSYQGDRKYEVYCRFGENLGIFKKGDASKHHNFGYLTHDFRVWVEAVPPKERDRFHHGNYTWKVLDVKDVGYKPEDGFNQAVQIYKTYRFAGDK